MYKEEIVAGLKNTMDRGYTLEQAVHSFINAGYAKEDVLDSAERLKQQPLLSMQVTAPEEVKEKKKSTRETGEQGFFQKLRFPHIHFPSFHRTEKPEQIKLPSSAPLPADYSRAQEMRSKGEAKGPLGREALGALSGIRPEDRMKIKNLELELKRRKREPEKKREPVETTALLELPKIAPRKVRWEKREISLEKVKVPKIIQKHEKKLEATEILGLPKTPPRRSDNTIFIILIVLLMMLLGALLFTFFYREAVLEIIKKILGE